MLAAINATPADRAHLAEAAASIGQAEVVEDLRIPCDGSCGMVAILGRQHTHPVGTSRRWVDPRGDRARQARAAARREHIAEELDADTRRLIATLVVVAPSIADHLALTYCCEVGANAYPRPCLAHGAQA